MSVIFQALQKLEPDRGDAALPVVDYDRGASMGTPGRRLLPRFIRLAVLAALVVGLGFGAVHGVGWLGAKASRTPEALSEPVRHTMPGATGQVPAQAVGAKPTAMPPRPVQARYYPPDARGQVAAMAATGSGDILSQTLPEDAPGQPDVHMAPTAGKRAVSTEFALGEKNMTQPDEAAQAQESPAKERQSPGQGDLIDPAWQAAEAARVAAIQKNARIGRLVRRIEVSLQATGHQPENPAGDGKTEALLGELARLKGEDSAYVNKLRAFRLMKAGHYEKAEPLLHKILAVNAIDLEAGLNLAVVLINTGRPDQAGERLRLLWEVYPDNGAVADLLRRLKR